MITHNDKFIVDTTKYIASELGDEMIFMNLETGDYINLNSVSSHIWKSIQGKTVSTEEIISSLLEKYEVTKDTCAAETISCLEEMVEKQLIYKAK